MEGFFAGAAVMAIIIAVLPPADITLKEVEWAKQSCSTNNGIEYIRPKSYWFYRTKAVCKNGAEFYYMTPAEVSP